jgi:hypothetical protein
MQWFGLELTMFIFFKMISSYLRLRIALSGPHWVAIPLPLYLKMETEPYWNDVFSFCVSKQCIMEKVQKLNSVACRTLSLATHTLEFNTCLVSSSVQPWCCVHYSLAVFLSSVTLSHLQLFVDINIILK